MSIAVGMENSRHYVPPINASILLLAVKYAATVMQFVLGMKPGKV